MNGWVKPGGITRMKHANVLVDDWMEPREKISVNHAEIWVALWIAGLDLKRNEQNDIKNHLFQQLETQLQQ